MSKQRYRRFLRWAICTSLIAGAGAVHAGTGKVRFAGGKQLLDFCVSVRFEATAAQIDEIKRAFTDGSAVFLDASDNQFEFGRVDIVNNSGASRQAEVWIHESSGRAVATYGKYGIPGEHINMYFPSNFSKSPSVDGDAYTVAHEFAHHVWGVADEYASSTGGAAECEPAPGSPTANFCLMDNYFTRGGNSGTGSTYTLNEFCVMSNHDPDMDTVQESFYMKSCWEHIGAHATRAATSPADLPTSGAPAPTAPTFREPGSQRRFSVVIDRSGSMGIMDGGAGTPTRLDLAKQAANLFIDLSKVGDETGVASFESTASTDFALTAIADESTKASAKAAVNSLTAGGATAIGLGLIEARDMITGAATISCAQTIILFTDGFGNTGPGELSVISSLVDNDISVITIAIGQSVSTANLSKIAADTNGKFFQVPTAAELPALLASLSAESTGGGILARQPGFVFEGETTTKTLLVEGATQELTIVMTTSPDNTMELSLQSPSGAVIDAAVAAASPDVDFFFSPGTRIFLVRRPVLENGDWTLIVDGVTVVDSRFDLTASSDATDVVVVASTDALQYTFPEPILVQATPSFRLPIVDALVSGTVTAPDGTQFLIDLFDDGDVAHGDVLVDDGTYSNLFTSFVESGSYRFDIVVETLGSSRTYGGEALFSDAGAPATEMAVPLLRRETSITAVVTDVPDNLPPVAAAGDDQNLECTDLSGTPARLDGSGSSDLDGDALTFEWKDAGGSVVGTSAIVDLVLPLGTHTFELTVDDGNGGNSTDTVTITVADTIPPDIVAANATPDILWPPNHKMAEVVLEVSVADLCDASPTCEIVDVQSDEPVSGIGPGDESPDWEFEAGSLSVSLRSERSGDGDGRTYTITVQCTDESGNRSTTTVSVLVPHDQGND